MRILVERARRRLSYVKLKELVRGDRPMAWVSGLVWALALGVCMLLSEPARAAPDARVAREVFAEAGEICARDGGALWGRSLCGPILLVDYRDRGVIGNQADAAGMLTQDGDVFRGVLPDDVVIANTPTDWAGIRWSLLVAEFPERPQQVSVLLAHELFHRVQGQLGLSGPEAGSRHLDTFLGRYWLQLEWRALAAALRARHEAGRVRAIEDAIAFRRERYRLFPDAARTEAQIEINEGIAEYTGVMLGLRTDRERIDYALADLVAFVDAPTFVRSFAYATGPAYGLLLDRADAAWRAKIAELRFDELLAEAMSVADDLGVVEARAARYDDGALRAREETRDQERLARVESYRARLVDGPVLRLPLQHPNFRFNPQTLTPLDGIGMIYPTARITDSWGVLEVEHGGVLAHDNPREATVAAPRAEPGGASGDGWRLTLNPGWTLREGPRSGDLAAVQNNR